MSLSSNMASFEGAVTQNLQCPICLCLINEPKLLSCSHNFCESCLTKQLLLLNHPYPSIKCPVCRQRTPVYKGDVSNLPTNKPLRAITFGIRSTANLCGVCDQDSKVNAYCHNCAKVLCDGCRKSHDEWKPNIDHNVVTLNNVSKNQVSSESEEFCEHPNQMRVCTDICVTCKKYICERCRLFNHAKKGHKVQSIVDYEAEIQPLKTEVGSILPSTCDQISQNSKCDIDTGLDEQLTKKLQTNGCLAVGQPHAGTQYLCARRSEISLNGDGNESFSKDKSEVTLKQSLIANGGICVEVKREPKREETRNQCIKGQHSTTPSLFISGPTEPLKQLSYVIKEEQIQSWHIDQGVQLQAPNSMECMVKTPNGRLAVGCSPGGIQVFSRDGRLLEIVLSHVNVRGLCFLSNGKYVVRDRDNKISVYSSSASEKDDVRFETLSDADGGHGDLTVDCDDHIYVGYRNARKIQVFSPAGGKPVREIACREYEPMQISAMKSSKLLVVKTSRNSVHVVDMSGAKQHGIVKDDDVIVHPTVGASDCILIAHLNEGTTNVSVNRYSSDLGSQEALLTEEFIRLTDRKWFCLEEISPGNMAFCTPDRLHTSCLPATMGVVVN